MAALKKTNSVMFVLKVLLTIIFLTIGGTMFFVAFTENAGATRAISATLGCLVFIGGILVFKDKTE